MNKLWWNLNRYTHILCQWDKFENVICKMAAIFVAVSMCWSRVSVGNHIDWCVNSLRPRDTYMRLWTRSSLVQIMACRLLGAKPLSEPMLTYSQSGHKEQNSVKYHSKLEHFHSRKCIWKCRLENGGHFVSTSMCWVNWTIHIMDNTWAQKNTNNINLMVIISC